MEAAMGRQSDQGEKIVWGGKWKVTDMISKSWSVAEMTTMIMR
jgi:hypothetical protein